MREALGAIPRRIQESILSVNKALRAKPPQKPGNILYHLQGVVYSLQTKDTVVERERNVLIMMTDIY